MAKRVRNCVIGITVCVLCVLALSGRVVGQKPELILQTGHSTDVQSVAFSRDGKLLASGSVEGVINLWDVASGAQLRSLEGHSSLVTSVAFSPDGRVLVSGSYDKSIKLWDVATGLKIRSLDGVFWAYSVEFNPNGNLLATVSADLSIKLWDVTSGNQVRTIAGSYLSVAFSPDGKLLAAGSSDNSIKLWYVESGNPVKSLEGNYAQIHSLGFSSDGKLVAGVNADRKLRIWDLATGTQLRVIEEFYGSARFSPDDTLMASGDKEGRTIRLLDCRSGSTVRSMGGRAPTEAKLLVFSPNGKLLAGGNSEGAIELWDAARGTQVGSLVRHADLVDAVAFSSDGKWLVNVAGDNSIKLWDVARGMPVRSLDWRAADATSNAMSNLSKQLAKIMDISQKVTPGQTHRLTSIVSSIAFSPDGKLLANGSSDGTVRLWDVARGIQLRSLSSIADGLSIGVTSIAFSPDGRMLASLSQTTIKLWDVKSGSKIRELAGHSPVNSVVFSPDGKLLASAGEDKTIKLWDVGTGSKLKEMEGHTAPVLSACFSPDGKILASASADDSIKLWNVSNGNQVKSFAGGSKFLSVAFSPDSKYIASWGVENSIKLWNAASGTQTHSLEGHSAKVTSVAFSPDGKFLLSGGRDSTMRLWNTSDGLLLAGLTSLDQKEWLVVTPDYLFDGSSSAWRRSIWRFKNNTFDYAPVEAFFSEFFHPGLLADIMSGKRPKAKASLEKKDIRQPQVYLLRADSQSVPSSDVTIPTVKVQIEVTEAPADQKKSLPPGGAQDVRLFRNGSLVKVWRGDVFALGPNDGCRKPKPGQMVCAADITVVAGENRFSAYAFNRDNVKSMDGELLVNGAGSLKRDGTLYVLAIGVNQYANTAYDLKYAVPDAREFGNEMKTQQDKLKLYAHTEIVSLTDQEATKDNILLALRRLADGDRVSVSTGAPQSLSHIKQSQPEDAIVIYFAGHGRADNDRFYMIPHEGITHGFSSSGEQGLKTLYARSISDVELELALERIDAGQLLMVIDACNSGQTLEADEKRRGPMNSKGLAQLAYEKGMYILAAAQSYQVARGSGLLGHGYLTYALVEEGLKTPAADASPRDNQLTLREWLDYSVERVPQMQEEGKEWRDLVQSSTNAGTEGRKEGIQRPRVFYRREADTRPLIVVMFGVK